MIQPKWLLLADQTLAKRIFSELKSCHVQCYYVRVHVTQI